MFGKSDKTICGQPFPGAIYRESRRKASRPPAIVAILLRLVLDGKSHQGERVIRHIAGFEQLCVVRRSESVQGCEAQESEELGAFCRRHSHYPVANMRGEYHETHLCPKLCHGKIKGQIPGDSIHENQRRRRNANG